MQGHFSMICARSCVYEQGGTVDLPVYRECEKKGADANWKQTERQRLHLWMEECNFSDSCKHLALACPSLSLSLSLCIRVEFPCSVKEPVHCDGSARREPEHSSGQPCHTNTQTHMHKHQQLYTLLPRLDGPLYPVGSWYGGGWGDTRGPALVFVYFFYCSKMEAIRGNLKTGKALN